MRKFLLAAVAALALAATAPALAADEVTPSGGATIENGVATLVSNTANASATDDRSAVTLPLPSGLTLAQITQLAAEFNVTDDDCSAGSPRFAINYGENKNVNVYLDPTASVSGGCLANTWLSTGNLVGTTDACRVDTSQISPGTQCTATWESAVKLIGSQPILSISLIVDSSFAFADSEQTVMVRNVKLNNKTFLVPTTPKPAKLNPTTACKAQQAAMGREAFNELWNKDGTSNGFGKCVSAAAKAQNDSAQTLRTMQSKIMNAAKTCKAKGLKGEKLGQCVAATDRVAATKTEAQENKGRR